MMRIIDFSKIKSTTTIPKFSTSTSSYDTDITEAKSIETQSTEAQSTEPISTTVLPQLNSTVSYQNNNFGTRDIFFPDQLPFFNNKIIFTNESTIAPTFNSTTTAPINLSTEPSIPNKNNANLQLGFMASIPVFFILIIFVLLLWFLYQKRREGKFMSKPTKNRTDRLKQTNSDKYMDRQTYKTAYRDASTHLKIHDLLFQCEFYQFA